MTFGNAAFLFFGILAGILALIAFLDAVKGTPVKHVVDFRGSGLPSVRDDAFQTSMELASRTEMVEGNNAEFFWNGDQTYPRLWEDLRSAKQSITFQMYWCKPGQMAEKLAEILIDRARAGVDVLLLYDAWGSSWKREYVQRLKDGGVRVEKFRPVLLWALNVINHRSHIRVVVVDGKVGWTGGFGIDDKWFGNGRTKGQWRDSNVRFTGPAVAQLQSAFTACWAEVSGELLVGRRLYPVNDENTGAEHGPLLAGVLHGSPSVGSTEAERFFALAIACAKEKLYITNSYFVPDRDFRRLMCEAAARGVDVRILTVSDETDVKSTWYAGRARYEHLLCGGVRVFEYQPTMIHAKTMVVDSHFCAVGSMNADNRSLSFNEESVLLMLDDQASAIVEGHFMEDLKYANEITLEQFRKRGIMPRIKEKVAYAFYRVL
ncbi:MAG TPA: phospholipase D-like domain-containing protein [Gemmatimonadaceae bacterium]|nr:phospholipase D-like domain-containing protein [Gemmatimonadaceae bacterium]